MFPVIVFGFWFEKDENKKEAVVGVVSLSKVDRSTLKGFKEKMSRLGWKEYDNITYIDYGPAGKIQKLDTKIKPLIKHNVDLIFVSSTPGTLAVKKFTQNKQIPVIFAPVNDPVASGIVKSLRNHGGHITGIKLPAGDAQRFKWLKKLNPTVKNVLVPYTPGDKSSEVSRKEAKKSAKAIGLNIIERPILKDEDTPSTLKSLPNDVDAIFLPRDSTIESKIDDYVKYANSRKIVLSAPSYQQVQKGALFAWGFMHSEIGKQAARMANLILNNVKPSDIPVEVARNYLVINMKTAKEIGLVIPQSIIRKTHLIVKE